MESKSHQQLLITPGHGFVPFEKCDIERSIPARFEDQVSRYPERVAVKTLAGETTYAALNRFANRIAHAIVAHLGSDQKTVALLLDKDEALIAAVLGLLKANKVCLPLDPSYPPARLSAVLQHAETALIITDDKTAPLADQIAHAPGLGICPVLNVDRLDPLLSTENLNLSVSPDNLARITYTSGTTGQPKGVVHDHRSILHAAMRTINSMGVSADDRCSMLATVGHSAGFNDALRALLNGAMIALYDINTRGIGGLAQWLIEQEITFYHSVPSVFRQMLGVADPNVHFASIRVLRLGGSTVSLRDVELYRKHFNDECHMVVNLASTEALTVCQYYLDKHTQITTNSVPVGYPVEDQEVVLLDEARRAVPPGQVGEIAVKSRTLSRGYWRQPDLTAKSFIPDPRGGDGCVYLSGDLGRMDASGCLEHLGRKNSQVKVRGYRIELGEVEAALMALDDVRDASVLAREDPAGERSLTAYIVPNTPSALTVSALHRGLAQRLPEYMIPSAYVTLDKLPLMPNGKVDQRALPAPGRSRPALDTPWQEPRTAIEAGLVQIWVEVLGLDQVGVDDNFFELGGHSLLATQVVARVHERFQVEIPLQVIFETPTISALGRAIEAGGTPPLQVAIAPLARETYRMQRSASGELLHDGKPS